MEESCWSLNQTVFYIPFPSTKYYDILQFTKCRANAVPIVVENTIYLLVEILYYS